MNKLLNKKDIQMESRKLVKVVQVDDVLVHDNADSLEIAIIGGWQ